MRSQYNCVKVLLVLNAVLTVIVFVVDVFIVTIGKPGPSPTGQQARPNLNSQLGPMLQLYLCSVLCVP